MKCLPVIVSAAMAMGAPFVVAAPQEATGVETDKEWAVIRLPELTHKPQQLMQRLHTLLQQKRGDVIAASFSTLWDTLVQLEQTGRHDAARAVARALLQCRTTAAPKHNTPNHPAAATISEEGYAALSSWTPYTLLDDVVSLCPMQLVFEHALQGTDVAAFVDQLAREAAAAPEDEQLVSCAAVAKVRRGGAVKEALRLADGLTAPARMRVAWRLRELAPSTPEDLALLAPALARGLEAMFQDPGYLNDGIRHFQAAEKLLLLLEQANAHESIQGLMPLFVKAMETAPLGAELWGKWTHIAQQHRSPALGEMIVRQWTRKCEKFMTDRESAEFMFHESITHLSRAASHLDDGQGHPFALLADTLWTTLIRRQAGQQDPDIHEVGQLCDLLIAYSEPERLMALISQLEIFQRLGAQLDLAHPLERARKGLEFLQAPARLAIPEVWVEDVPEDETTGRVHWTLITPLTDRSFITLKRLNKKHHLKVFAGRHFDALQPMDEKPLIAASGMVEVKHLPSSGVVQVMLCDESSRHMSMGSLVLYSLRHPLIDSDDAPDAEMPEWKEEWLMNYHPLGRPVPVDGGLSVLIDRFSQPQTSWHELQTQLKIVGLDENKKPLWARGAWRTPGLWAATRRTADTRRPCAWQPLTRHRRSMGPGMFHHG